jgi:hypothetical protein
MKRACSASVHVSRGLLMTYGLRCRPPSASALTPPPPPPAFVLACGGGRPAGAAWAAVPEGAAMWWVRSLGRLLPPLMPLSGGPLQQTITAEALVLLLSLDGVFRLVTPLS